MTKNQMSELARKAGSLCGKEFFEAFEVPSGDYVWCLKFDSGAVEALVRPNDFASSEEIVEEIRRH